MFFSGPSILKTLLLATYVINRFKEDNILVRLSHGGQVKGTILRSAQGLPFYAFRGIPYAEPPTGALRFKPPVPKDVWSDPPFDATKDGPICYQEDIMGQYRGTEDCLTVNVYSPKLPKENENFTKLAVMVYIFGGSFMLGDGTSASYSPNPLMDYNIVLVTMNYRVDALGFLSTGDASSPRNYGLLDQRLALVWVKDNIEAFGGDAKSVTIFGQSAGGASVSYHLISPLSKGLFHRAISMSGSSLSPWTFQPNPIHEARHLASFNDCPEEPTQKLIDCLRNKSAAEINLGIMHYTGSSSLPNPFGPTVDGYFLPATPKDVMSEKPNKVPVLTGITKAEKGLQVWWMYQMSAPGEFQTESFIPNIFNNSVSNQDLNVIQNITERYFRDIDRNNEEELVLAVTKALSHGLFDMNHYEEIQLLSKAGLTVYAYSYEYVAESVEETLFAHIPPLNVTTHGEELFLFFDLDLFGKLRLTENDTKMANILMRLWTNFAKTGNPDPTNEYLPSWKPSTPDEIHIHHLNLDITSKAYAVNEDELFHFWTKDIHFARTAKKQK